MTHERAPAARHPHVERVAGAAVGVVEPGGDRVEAADLAAVLVGDQVLGIVESASGELPLAERLALEEAASHGPVTAVLCGERYRERLVASMTSDQVL